MLQQNEQEEMLKFQENSKRKSQVLEHFLQEEHETLLEQYETLWETHQQMIVQHKQNVERLENQIDLLKKDSKDNTIKVHLEHVETQTRPENRDQQSQTIYMERFICIASQTDSI